MSSTRVRLRRSASGRTRKRPRSNMGAATAALELGFISRSLGENAFEQSLSVLKIGNDNIGSNTQQSTALPLINVSRTVIGFITGHSNRESSDFLCVLDLNVTVSE